MLFLRLLNKMGLILKEYHPRNSEHALLKHLINKYQINLILDVGANTGQFASSLRKDGYEEEIISFEPLKTAFIELEKKASKDNKWFCHNCAIGKEETSQTINVAGNSASSSLLKIHENHVKAAPVSKTIATEIIHLKRLDQIVSLKNAPKSLLKIDTQGFEMEVINGADSLLEEIDIILVELSFKLLYTNGPLYTSVIKKLEENGFELFQLFPEFVDPDTSQLLQANGFFVNTKRLESALQNN